MFPLRQSTSQTIRIGPIVSPSDGVTPVTGLSAPSNANITLTKNGAPAAYTVASWTEFGRGLYTITLSTTDTNTTGRLILDFGDYATYDPFTEKYDVLSGGSYDALYANTGTGIPCAPVAGSIDVATLTFNLSELLLRAYLMSTGTTSPVSADQWAVGGIYATSGIVYYVSKTTGLYAWSNGSIWTVSTALGVNGASYWTTAASATVSGPYSAQGSATGTPVFTPHGNAVLSGFQPDVTPPATDASGRVTLTPAEHTLISGTDAPAALTAQGYTSARATKLDQLDAAVSTRSTYAGGAVASVTAAVTVGTNNDKSGYSLAPTQSFNNSGQTTKLGATLAAGDVTGNLPANAVQWGGSAVTGMPLPTGGYTAPDNATLAHLASALQSDGSGGYQFTSLALAHAPTGSGGGTDPWSVAIPGSYGAGTAGYLVGHNLDAQVSTRLATSAYTAAPAVSAIAAGILATPANLLVTDGSGRVTAGSVADKAGYSLAPSQSYNNTGQTANLPANALQWGSAAVTAMPLPTSSYTPAPTTGAITTAILAATPTFRAQDSVTAPNVGDCLACAWVDAAGKEAIVGTAYTTRQPDGVTVFRSFSLDSGTTPTSRS